jgi:multimeric flavodoxin WrbA
MKMLGLTCGSKKGNSEILIKSALMGAEELGMEVELLRMSDLDIRPCIACPLGTCPSMIKGPTGCVIKDDAPFLYDKMMDCDAIIFSVPIYTKTPPGQLKAIGDRILGPKVDVAFKIEQKKLKEESANPIFADAWIDERVFKNRVGGLISVGGATSPDWVNLGLPLLHIMTFSWQIAIVDQMQVMGAGFPGSVLVNEDKPVERAKKLGRNIAEQVGKPFNNVEYKGDDPGICPVCHLNMIAFRNGYVECVVCGSHGQIKMVGDKPTVEFPEEWQKKSILQLEGKRIHFYEIMEVTKKHMPQMEKIKELAKPYHEYDRLIKPPRKKTTKR